MLCREAESRIARARAPDCDENATFPRAGMSGPNWPSRLTAGSVLSNPMQFGPTIRIPAERTNASSSSSSSIPAPPTSENPAVITTSALTPFSMHSSTLRITNLAGTTMNARSTLPGTSRIEGYAATDRTTGDFGLTGYTGPLKFPLTRLLNRRPPMVSGSRLAPTTATDCGAISGIIDFTAARRSHSSRTAAVSSVSSVGRVIVKSPSSAVAFDAVARRAEHAHHHVVVGEQVRPEPFDPLCSCVVREPVEEERAEALLLVLVTHGEGGIGGRRDRLSTVL